MPLHTGASVELNQVAISASVARETIPQTPSLSGQTKSNRNKRPYR